MAEDIYRPQPSNLSKEDIESLPDNHPLRQNVQPQNQQPKSLKPEDVMNIPGVTGRMPPQVAAAMQKAQQSNQEDGPFRNSNSNNSVNTGPVKPNIVIPRNASLELANLLEAIKGQSFIYEEITLPSLGRFYNGEDGPINGKLSIRPMTGEEEQILAKPRFVKKGQAIDMIFQRCIQEPVITQ